MGGRCRLAPIARSSRRSAGRADRCTLAPAQWHTVRIDRQDGSGGAIDRHRAHPRQIDLWLISSNARRVAARQICASWFTADLTRSAAALPTCVCATTASAKCGNSDAGCPPHRCPRTDPARGRNGWRPSWPDAGHPLPMFFGVPIKQSRFVINNCAAPATDSTHTTSPWLARMRMAVEGCRRSTIIRLSGVPGRI
jgi:hypothetical protein